MHGIDPVYVGNAQPILIRVYAIVSGLLRVSRECIIGTDLSLRRSLLIESIRRSHAPITDQGQHCSLIDQRCTRRDPRLIPNRDCTVRVYDSFRIIITSGLILIRIHVVRFRSTLSTRRDCAASFNQNIQCSP